jgi:ribosomal protein S18 acetylase RimI-like enzyme
MRIASIFFLFNLEVILAEHSIRIFNQPSIYTKTIHAINHSVGWDAYNERITTCFKTKPCILFLAYEDNYPCGYALLNTKASELECVAVNPYMQGRGIGKDLLNEVINYCLSRNYRFLKLRYRTTSRKLERFYTGAADSACIEYTVDNDAPYASGARRTRLTYLLRKK